MDILKLVTQKEFYISDRKEFISCDLRPEWRISLLILILHLTGRSNKASRNKAHLANWVLKNTKHESSFMDYIRGRGMRPFINLDPAMDKAIDYAMYSKLLTINGNRLQLTDTGINLAANLALESIFIAEKATLSRIKKALTEENVTNSFEGKL